MLSEQQFYLFGRIQNSQIGGQLCIDTSPYKVSECSLFELTGAVMPPKIKVYCKAKKILHKFTFIRFLNKFFWRKNLIFCFYFYNNKRYYYCCRLKEENLLEF